MVTITTDSIDHALENLETQHPFMNEYAYNYIKSILEDIKIEIKRTDQQPLPEDNYQSSSIKEQLANKLLPSKENARIAEQYVQNLTYVLPKTKEHDPETGLLKLKHQVEVDFLQRFIKAAQSRLPTEDSIRRDREKGRQRKLSKKESR